MHRLRQIVQGDETAQLRGAELGALAAPLFVSRAAFFAGANPDGNHHQGESLATHLTERFTGDSSHGTIEFLLIHDQSFGLMGTQEERWRPEELLGTEEHEIRDWGCYTSH